MGGYNSKGTCPSVDTNILINAFKGRREGTNKENGLEPSVMSNIGVYKGKKEGYKGKI
jgi:hypothetical protein